MQHKWDDSPYGSTGLKYYTRFDISGPTLVCTSNSTYTFDGGTSGLNLSWTSSSQLTAVSSTDSTFTVRAKSSSVSGQGWVKATFTTAGGETIEKRFNTWVGNPYPSEFYFINGIGEEEYFCTSHNNNKFDVITNPLSACDLFEFKLTNITETQTITQYSTPSSGGRLDFPHLSEGFYLFHVRARNSCGWSEWFVTEVEYADCSVFGGGGEFELYMSPNPASETLNLSVEEVNTQTTTTSLTTYQESTVSPESYEIQIWSERNGLVKRKKLKGNKIQMDISSLQPGLYFVHLIYKDKVVKKQLIIK